MSRQISIFDEPLKYCVDTNVILNFWKLTPDEPYGKDVFTSHWEYFERKVQSGAIVAPRIVGTELDKWDIPDLKVWLRQQKRLFIDLDTAQATAMRPIANRYKVYTVIPNYAADLQIMGLAAAKTLAVITSESRKGTHTDNRPKIPAVCSEFEIDCVSVVEFFRREGVNR